MVGGRVLTVVVPRKGVVKGQVFEAQTQAPMDESPEFLSVPQGFWKDGFFDFCRLGPMHPSIVLAVCCPLLALGQITTRLGLKWNGEPTSEPSQIKLTFLIFLFLTVLRMFLSSWYILSIPPTSYSSSHAYAPTCGSATASRPPFTGSCPTTIRGVAFRRIGTWWRIIVCRWFVRRVRFRRWGGIRRCTRRMRGLILVRRVCRLTCR